jgi:hypothetical protein
MIKRTPFNLPPEVAQRFVVDMRAYFNEPNAIKRDEIAARQLYVLQEYRRPHERRIRLADVKQLFALMRDQDGF